jgi:hypothetical protein
MAWEVMAALANGENPEAAIAMVYELRGVVLSASAAMAAHEDRMDDYWELAEMVYGDDAGYMARLRKAQRFWAEDEERLKTLRMRYSWTPINLVFKARNEGAIYGLAIDNGTRVAKIDDLLYFLENINELTFWALDELENKD